MLMKDGDKSKWLALSQLYSWESSSDVYRDIDEAVEEIREQMGTEFKGNMRVTITYEE